MVTAYDHPSAARRRGGRRRRRPRRRQRRQQRARLHRHRPGDRRRAADARGRRATAGCATPLLVGDLPFGSYEASDEQAIATAHRFVKEAGCDAVKVEGSAERARAIVRAGVPVMGHVGLTPQTATALGGYRAQGRTAERAPRGARRGARAPGGGLLRDRLRGDPGGRHRRDHGRDGDPGDRDRRRREHRRPGARPARPARDQRRLPAEVRQALRGRARRDAPRARRRTPRTSARGRFPGPEHTYGIAPEELHRLQDAVPAAARQHA